MISSGAVT